MLGAFVGGGKYSLSCARAVAVNGLPEVKPGCLFREQLEHGPSNGVFEPSTAFWIARESFVAALLFAREDAVCLPDAYMYDERLSVILW